MNYSTVKSYGLGGAYQTHLKAVTAVKSGDNSGDRNKSNVKRRHKN
jgi:hypothetical protein